MNAKCRSCPEDRYIGPYGDDGSTVAVVGEQPIENHPSDSDVAFALDLDRTQRSSEILEMVFGELDYEWEDLYWTNALKCPVVANRDDCLDLLEVELLKFSKVVVLGSNAREIVPDGPYEKVHIWHPAYVLRDPERFEEYVGQWEEALGSTLDQQSLGRWQ